MWEIKNQNFYNFIKTMISLKKNDFFRKASYHLETSRTNGVIEAHFTKENEKWIGLFNVEQKTGSHHLNLSGEYLKKINLEDQKSEIKKNQTKELSGNFINLLDQTSIKVDQGKIELSSSAMIIKIS